MRKERILAVIMSVLLALSMISATVFAAEIPALDGKLKIQGTAAEGRTLSAEFKEVKPEGVTEDDVAYLWERKTVEDEETEKAGEKPELKELGHRQRRKWLYRKSESCIRYSNRCADCCWPGGKSSRRKGCRCRYC